MGRFADAISEAAKEKGETPPESVVHAPELRPENTFIWTAFHDLDGCRHLGYGAIGAIPWTALNDYAIRHAISDFDFFVRVIRELDMFYLNKIAEEMKRRNGG